MDEANRSGGQTVIMRMACLENDVRSVSEEIAQLGSTTLAFGSQFLLATSPTTSNALWNGRRAAHWIEVEIAPLGWRRECLVKSKEMPKVTATCS